MLKLAIISTFKYNAFQLEKPCKTNASRLNNSIDILQLNKKTGV